MGSSLLDRLGMGHIIAGSVSAGTDAALTTTDGAASLTRNGAGDFTVTFGQNFNASPVVVANIVDATDSTDEAHSIALASVGTDGVQFNVKTTTTNGTATEILSALADIAFHFIAIGSRNK